MSRFNVPSAETQSTDFPADHCTSLTGSSFEAAPSLRIRQLTRTVPTVNILYLENHAVFAAQVTSQFLRAHRVTVVPSLAAARIALASGGFDLVLSDYDLDDGKGDAFVSECRAKCPRLPVIAVSSHEAGNAALAAAGASAVCGKMEFDRIQQVIEGLELEGVAKEVVKTAPPTPSD